MRDNPTKSCRRWLRKQLYDSWPTKESGRSCQGQVPSRGRLSRGRPTAAAAAVTSSGRLAMAERAESWNGKEGCRHRRSVSSRVWVIFGRQANPRTPRRIKCSSRWLAERGSTEKARVAKRPCLLVSVLPSTTRRRTAESDHIISPSLISAICRPHTPSRCCRSQRRALWHRRSAAEKSDREGS